MCWLIQVREWMLSGNLTICPVQEFIQRWGVVEDSPVELVGDPGDGTTIDLDEPFLLRWNHFHVYVIKDSRIGCDDDGWFVKTNKEPSYPHFFHLFTHTEIRSVLFKGDLDIRYIGFGDQSKRDVPCFQLSLPPDLQPAPYVGFNLTFVCPEGEVFDNIMIL